MPPSSIPLRQEPLEQFSTFLQLDGDRPQGWRTDNRLRRNMEAAIAKLNGQAGSERFWILYWHRLWREQAGPHRVCGLHLCAYLQEACYWAAQKTAARLVGFANRYSLADCFQIAIARYEHVLQGFKSEAGTSLKNYGISVFTSVIGQALREQREVNICSDWSLLRKLSETGLRESLAVAGHTPRAIDQFVLAWRCLLALYAPSGGGGGSRRLSPPSPALWEAILNLYNREVRSSMSGLEAVQTAQTLEHWLLGCTKAVRNHRYPLQRSINAPLRDHEGAEWLEVLPQMMQPSVLEEVIRAEEIRERLSQREELQALLGQKIMQMDAADQRMLELYYGRGLTQQEIAEQLLIKQYTVSRRLTRLRESLLKALAHWRISKIGTPPSLSQQEGAGALLDEWLQEYYRPHPPQQDV